MPRVTLASFSVKDRIINQAMKMDATASELDLLLYIAQHESTFNPYAKNSKSTASGLYQYLTSTWNYQCKGDIWDVEDQTTCALNDIRIGRASQWAVL